MRLLRHLLAIGLLPFVVTVVVPAYIIRSSTTLNAGWDLPSPLGLLPTLLGCVLVGLGVLLVFKTVILFATVGEGTLAPWDPPRRLVVRGPYRHVRNPMISGVLSILLGEDGAYGRPHHLLGCLRDQREGIPHEVHHPNAIGELRATVVISFVSTAKPYTTRRRRRAT